MLKGWVVASQDNQSMFACMDSDTEGRGASSNMKFQIFSNYPTLSSPIDVLILFSTFDSNQARRMQIAPNHATHNTPRKTPLTNQFMTSNQIMHDLVFTENVSEIWDLGTP